MHGRVKVKTSAQQQEEKRIEREGKLKSYRSVSNQVHSSMILPILFSDVDIGLKQYLLKQLATITDNISS